MTEFENEDKIINLVVKQQKPVFLYYYVPGEWQAYELHKLFRKLAKKHSEYPHLSINSHLTYLFLLEPLVFAK